MADAYIIDACRTPRGIGKQGKGALSHLHPQHLGRTVLDELERQDKQVCLITMCAGGGMAPAVIIERV